MKKRFVFRMGKRKSQYKAVYAGKNDASKKCKYSAMAIANLEDKTKGVFSRSVRGLGLILIAISGLKHSKI